jgi:hypothetical protein
VLHNLGFKRNLMSIRNMSDDRVHTQFHMDICRIVIGAMLLMKLIHIGNLYKLLGNVD